MEKMWLGRTGRQQTREERGGSRMPRSPARRAQLQEVCLHHLTLVV